MRQDASELLRRALALPPEGRAALAGSLIDSLDEEVDEQAELAWRAEVERRLSELNQKAVATVPWPEARRRIADG